MIEVLFILFVMFVAYVIYRPAGEQNTPTRSPVIQAESKQPIVSLIRQTISEKPAVAAKLPASRPVSKKEKVIIQPKAAAKGKSTPELVGLTAGSIWNYLDKNAPTTVAKLVRELKENDKTIQRSIGWLAQEDKIILKIIDRAETIALNE